MTSVTVIGGIFREILNGDTNPQPRLGGSGLTAAIIAARFGARTTLVSYVGDEDASATVAMLETAGVEHSLAILPGASGTFVFPTEREAGARPWPMYRPAEAVPESSPAIPEADIYALFGMPDSDAVAAAWLDGLPVEATLLWDRQGWLSRARDCRAAGALPPQHKLYLANIDEALEEFPAENVPASLARLPPADYAAAVVKQGRHGCTVIDVSTGERRAFRIDGFPLHVTSTIGSGDAFAGALVAGLAAGRPLEQAALLGNAAAAVLLGAGGDPLTDGLPEQARTLVAERTSGGR